LCGIVAHQLQEARFLHNDSGDHDENDNDVTDDTNPVAASSSSSCVYLTDGDTDALVQLRHNVRNNQRSDRIHCQQLLWGTASATAFAQTYGTVDVLLASDIVYVGIPPRASYKRNNNTPHHSWATCFSRGGGFYYRRPPVSFISLSLSHVEIIIFLFPPFFTSFLLPGFFHCASVVGNGPSIAQKTRRDFCFRL
jgi:Lysine methyltransferase